MCEEYETVPDRSGQPVVGGQSSSSLVLSAIITEVLLDSDDPAYQNFLLQQYGQRIEKLSQQDKLSKFCMDEGFLNVVEIGQYFMTKDIAEFSHNLIQWLVVNKSTSQPKGWIQGNTKNWARIGSCTQLFTRQTWR